MSNRISLKTKVKEPYINKLRKALKAGVGYGVINVNVDTRRLKDSIRYQINFDEESETYTGRIFIGSDTPIRGKIVDYARYQEKINPLIPGILSEINMYLKSRSMY